MNNRIFFLVALFFLTACKSISQIPQPYSHITDNLLNKYQGSWRWVFNNDTVIIKIAKVIHYYNTPPQSTADRIAGCHIYIKNNLVVESSMNKYDSTISINDKLGTIYGWSDTDTDTIRVEGIFKDISKQKKGRLFLEYINSVPAQLIWHLQNPKGLSVTLPGEQPFDESFTLPKDMLLTKIQ